MSPTIRSDARHPTINATTVILEPSDPLRNHHCHHKENFKRCERREIEGEREREREREGERGRERERERERKGDRER